MLVDMRQGGDWPTGVLDEPANEYDPPQGGLFVYMNITDPHGNATVFEIVFTQSQSSSQYALVLWRINVTQQSSGLNTTALYNANNKYSPYDGIGGIIAYNGIYNVTITSIFPSRQEPPSFIEIRKGQIITEQPYHDFLYGGIVIVAMGTVTSAFGLKSSKQKALVKKKKQLSKVILALLF